MFCDLHVSLNIPSSGDIHSMNLPCLTLVGNTSGPEVIKLFSYSTQLSKKFILLINVKMPTIVGI